MKKWLVVKPKNIEQRAAIFAFLIDKGFLLGDINIATLDETNPLEKHPYVTIPYLDNQEKYIGTDTATYGFDKIVSVMELYNWVNNKSMLID